MLKAMAGSPGNQMLILGLSFGNLDKFKAHPHDTYICITKEEMDIPMDVILYSGDGNRALGSRNGRPTFMLGLTMEQLDTLRQKPGKSYITLDKDIYHTGLNITIFAGETEAAMTSLFEDVIGPSTKVSTDKRNFSS